MAVGCSAETGDQGPEAQIGSTEQAITTSSTVASVAMVDQTTPTPVAQAREFASSCKIKDSNSHEYLVVVGGLSNASTPTNTIFVFDPTALTPKWVGAGTFGTSGTDEVAEAAMMTIPGDDQHCLLVGGTKGTTATDKLWAISVSTSGAPTAVQQGKLNEARSNHQLIRCGNEILIAGGKANTTIRSSYEVWDPSGLSGTAVTSVTARFLKNTNASPANVSMIDARYDFAIAAKDNFNILIAGGYDNSTYFRTVESLKIDSAGGNTVCRLDSTTLTTSTKLTTGGSTNVLSVGRTQLAAFYNTSSTDFIVAAGDNNGTAKQTVDTLSSVNFDPSVHTVTVSSANSVPTAVARPLFVPIDGTRFLLVGGGNPGTAINEYQEYSNGTWTHATVYSGGASLPSRLGATGVFINSAVYAVGGLDSGSTFLNSMDKVGPTGL
jgi:hypothetical protein